MKFIRFGQFWNSLAVIRYMHVIDTFVFYHLFYSGVAKYIFSREMEINVVIKHPNDFKTQTYVYVTLFNFYRSDGWITIFANSVYNIMNENQQQLFCMHREK